MFGGKKTILFIGGGLVVGVVLLIVIALAVFGPLLSAGEALGELNNNTSQLFKPIRDFFANMAGKTTQEEIYQQIASRTHNHFKYTKDDEGNETEKTNEEFTENELQAEQMALDVVTSLYSSLSSRYSAHGLSPGVFGNKIDSILGKITESAGGGYKNYKIKEGNSLKNAVEGIIKDDFGQYIQKANEKPEEIGLVIATEVTDLVKMYYDLFGIVIKKDSKSGCEFTYYNQRDDKWKDAPFGKHSTVGPSGCGPTSLAMVVQTFMPETNTTPDVMAKFATANNYVNNSGNSSESYWTLFTQGLNKYTEGKMNASTQFNKLVYQDGQYYMDSVDESKKLDLNKYPVIVSTNANSGVLKGAATIEGCPTFTRGGHIMVIKGSDGQGNVILADPNSEEKSNTPYSTTCLNAWSSNSGYFKVDSSIERQCANCGTLKIGTSVPDLPDNAFAEPLLIEGPDIPDNVKAVMKSPIHEMESCALRTGDDDYGFSLWRGRQHNGTDVNAVPGNVQQYSTVAGTVITAGSVGGYGNTVEVEFQVDGQTYFVRHAHLDDVQVSVGQQVTQDTPVGITGSSGFSTGIHFHTEVHGPGGNVGEGNSFNTVSLFPQCENYDLYYDQSSCNGANVTDGDKQILYQIVQAEAGGESYEGKKAVAQVTIYRAVSSGKTIKEVVYAAGQYEPVENGSINNTPSEETVRAVDAVISGDPVTCEAPTGAILPADASAFYNPNTVRSAWHESLRYVCMIGNHKFFAN